MTRIGEILRSAREGKDLTQETLAEHIGVCVRTIIAIEKGHGNPTCEVLFRLVHFLEGSADLLFDTGFAQFTPEMDQYIRELQSCDEKDQRVVITTSRELVRALRHSKSEQV